MEVLDSVFNTFSKLDKDFARCKKSRSEFIIGKFGGDIVVGSTIILDTLNNANLETQEDITKLSFIKDIFAKLIENSERLDSLKDFSFRDSAILAELTSVLEKSAFGKNVVVPLEQRELYAMPEHPVHFRIDKGCGTFCPLDSCTVFHNYNKNMQRLINVAFPKVDGLRPGAYYKVERTGELTLASDKELSRIFK